MKNPFSGMDNGDKATFAGVAATVIVWWIFHGKNKYSMKGMK